MISSTRFVSAGFAALVWLFAAAVDANAQCTPVAPDPNGNNAAAIELAIAASPSRCVTLQANTVYPLERPIVITGVTGTDPRPQIIGQGASTVLLPTLTNGSDPDWVSSGRYKNVIKVNNQNKTTLKNFKIDMVNLRRDWAGGPRIKGNYAVLFDASGGSTMDGVTIAGSRIDVAGYTSGGTTAGGVKVNGSANVQILNSTITDIGYLDDTAPTFQGAEHAGIQLANSANALVQNNTIIRVGFGILVTNFTGTTKSSDYARVLSNTIYGSGSIRNCADCSINRAIKFSSVAPGSSFPIYGAEVRYNNASDLTGSGGFSAPAYGGTGLLLENDVVKGVFTDNRFDGTAYLDDGCKIASSPQTDGSAEDPTYHNTFDRNYFRGGRHDLSFAKDGPNQIGLYHSQYGTNDVRSATVRFEGAYDQGCNAYAHAWWAYPAGQTYVNRGQTLSLSADGIRNGTQVTFKFKRNGVQVASFSLPGANGCVSPTTGYVIPSSLFTAGTYQVYATWADASADLVVPNAYVGDLVVK
jgi:hypothetical protein